MKSFIKKALSLFLILVMLVCVASCGKDTVNYSEAGLNFSLPKYMEKRNFMNVDLAFSSNEDRYLQFHVYFYTNDTLMGDPTYMPKDVTVEYYAMWFIAINEYTNVDKSYDEAGRKIVLRYVYEPENTYFCDYILRNDEALYHVTMTCDAGDKDKYIPMFEEWMNSIYLDY